MGSFSKGHCDMEKSSYLRKIDSAIRVLQRECETNELQNVDIQNELKKVVNEATTLCNALKSNLALFTFK